MRYLALATDYDGTIAHDGVVDDATLDALRRLRESKRRVVLVTGRELDEHDLFAPDTLLYYWPYGRFGINFHPPLAGQLNLLTYELFGRWMKDIPARASA